MTRLPRATSRHSAPAQAAGYLYQCERALVELLSRSADANATLFMERLDDVDIETDGQPIELLQLKHHTGAGGQLTDQSVDLWRTIGVWVDGMATLSPGESAIFTLVSTSVAPPESAAALLAEGPDHDSEAALSALELAATNSSNRETERARNGFMGLDSANRRRLVEGIRVRASESHLEELDDKIASALSLRLLFRENQVASFVARLKAWWYAQCVSMLVARLSVSTTDLAAFVQGLRESFGPEDLPRDLDLPEPTDAEVAEYESSVFVEQLKWIAYTNRQLGLAISDYHRAFAQRSRWSREGLVFPGELDQYERRLVEQWRRVFADMLARLGSGATEPEQQAAGMEMLTGLRDSNTVTIRPRYAEVFVNSGTLHALADDGSVGWHPDFERRVQALLSGVA